jgi:CheY-like chemotaxis protein
MPESGKIGVHSHIPCHFGPVPGGRRWESRLKTYNSRFASCHRGFSFPVFSGNHLVYKTHLSGVCPRGVLLAKLKLDTSLRMIRILIADDSEQVRKSLRHLLEQHSDWEVCGEAIDGRDTLDKLAQLAPDVIVLDLAMPGLDGLEVTRRIIKMHKPIAVLLCSMYVDPQLSQSARRAGVSGLVSKSNPSQIIAGIEAAIRGERLIASRA